jgi:NAD(P)-dependent dehydrogenase (short-subunit alcohol dehydrogenase family)
MAGPGAHPFSLADKTVLIAGGASGIGASTATICAALGAKLVVADISDAMPVVDKLRRDGHRASAASCDITDRAAVESLVSGAGALDALIVCSGICPFDDWMADDWDDVYNRTNAVNVKGTVNCVRAALPGIDASRRRKDRAGRLARRPQRRASVRPALCRIQRRDRRAGAVVRPQGRAAQCSGQRRRARPGRYRHDRGPRTQSRCRPARPHCETRGNRLDIAFLCSPAASYVCGVMLDVNGGVYMA